MLVILLPVLPLFFILVLIFEMSVRHLAREYSKKIFALRPLREWVSISTAAGLRETACFVRSEIAWREKLLKNENINFSFEAELINVFSLSRQQAFFAAISAINVLNCSRLANALKHSI